MPRCRPCRRCPRCLTSPAWRSSPAMDEARVRRWSRRGRVRAVREVRQLGDTALCDDKEDQLYDRARDAIENGRYERALDDLNRLLAMNGARADAALYWKVYSLAKMGQRAEALTAAADLAEALQRQQVAEGHQGAGGRAPPGVGPGGVARRRERRGAEAARAARPDAERSRARAADDREAAGRHQLDQGEGERAVRPHPEPIGARPRDHRRRRQGRREPGPATAGDPLSRRDEQRREPADSRRCLPRDAGSGGEARHHPQLHDVERSRAAAGARQGRKRRRAARRSGAAAGQHARGGGARGAVSERAVAST